MRTFAALAALLVAAIVVVGQTLFVVDQTQYGVVTRFGQIQRVITDPGLNVKTPFVDQVTRFDNRLLRIDIPTQSMPDKDSQFLEIDAYVRYRIEDPRKFWVTLTNELTAESRIGQIVISELRRVVAESDRADIIGGAPTTVAETGAVVVVAKKTSQGIDTREALTRRVLQNANEIVTSARNDFGIEIRDVRIKAADFPKTVEQSVFTRMKTEREVQAKRLRAEGEQQSLNITSEVDKQVTIIRATAEREANRLRGEGEAQAISIFAQALNQDPEFYAFQRSLEAYKKSLSKNTTVVLSSESDLFRYLQSPAVPTPEP